jgi:hypothetical protein
VVRQVWKIPFEALVNVWIIVINVQLRFQTLMCGDRSVRRMLVDVILDPLYEFGDSNINSWVCASTLSRGNDSDQNVPILLFMQYWSARVAVARIRFATAAEQIFVMETAFDESTVGGGYVFQFALQQVGRKCDPSGRSETETKCKDGFTKREVKASLWKANRL